MVPVRAANLIFKPACRYGYCGAYKVERLWRDAKLIEIGGGTVEAHQKNMTRDMARLRQLP